jgi:AmmeMemoRadiSam system protein A
VLRPESKTLLLSLAKSALESALAQKDVAFPPLESLPDDLTSPRGVFVTLRIHQALRGCVGDIDSQRPLAYDAMDTAIASAQDDPRFPPLTLEECAGLTIEISVLTPFERIQSADAITPDVHGVLVKRGRYRGLFLPQVWKESGWDKERFLNELCHSKAGLPEYAWKETSTELYVFEVESFATPPVIPSP